VMAFNYRAERDLSLSVLMSQRRRRKLLLVMLAYDKLGNQFYFDIMSVKFSNLLAAISTVKFVLI
jgi:hypothetical protein